MWSLILFGRPTPLGSLAFCGLRFSHRKHQEMADQGLWCIKPGISNLDALHLILFSSIVRLGLLVILHRSILIMTDTGKPFNVALFGDVAVGKTALIHQVKRPPIWKTSLLTSLIVRIQEIFGTSQTWLQCLLSDPSSCGV